MRAGSLSGSVTLMQALWRDLKTGETRISLVRKCIRALDPEARGPLMKPFACMSACMHDLAAVAPDAEVSSSAPNRAAEETKGPMPKRPKA